MFALAALWCCAGCDSGNPETIPVVGQVTLNGGRMPAKGTVHFLPEPAAGTADGRNRPALAHFDQSGQFSATTWERGDGLRPGKYRVTVECWKESPSMSSQGVSYVDPKYLNPAQSGLSLEVAPDEGKMEVSWNVTGPAEPIELGKTGVTEGEMKMN